MDRTETIKSLIPYLPLKNTDRAFKFLNSRDFLSLLELVKSDVYLVRKNNGKEHPNKNYVGLDLGKIIELQDIIEDYMIYLDIDIYYSDNYE